MYCFPCLQFILFLLLLPPSSFLLFFVLPNLTPGVRPCLRVYPQDPIPLLQPALVTAVTIIIPHLGFPTPTSSSPPTTQASLPPHHLKVGLHPSPPRALLHYNMTDCSRWSRSSSPPSSCSLPSCCSLSWWSTS